MTPIAIRRVPHRLAVHVGLWLALVAGLSLKAAILLAHSITFDADEAILGLMARHILQGERPLFFYGQSYMGALDAYLTIPFFLVMGQTVLAMRLLQVVLYAVVLVTTYVLALRLAGDRFGATCAALFVGLPPVLFSLYTSSTLGDYNEILLLNNLLLLMGFDIVTTRRRSLRWFFAAGVLGGLGWWSMGLIVVSLAPLGMVGLWRLWKRLPWAGLGSALLGFLLGASPWLFASLSRGAGATFADLSGAFFSGPDTPGERALSMVLFNLPALFGLRPSWSVDWIALPVGVAVVGFYGVALWDAAKISLRPAPAEDERVVWVRLMTLGWVVLIIAFLLTPFGGDPTGRYLLPLYPGLAVLAGSWLARLRGSAQVSRVNRNMLGAWLIVSVCLAYNLWGNVRSMLDQPPGITKQFDPISQIADDHDDDLIRFLDSIGADRGYSNYWVTFRFAFLTGERVIFSPRLPYKADLGYTFGDDRYPAYSQMVDAARQVVYVTSNHPVLDGLIAQRLNQQRVSFERKQIGPYTVFYNLSRKVTPDDLGPFGEVSGRAVHAGDGP